MTEMAAAIDTAMNFVTISAAAMFIEPESIVRSVACLFFMRLFIILSYARRTWLHSSSRSSEKNSILTPISFGKRSGVAQSMQIGHEFESPA